MSPGSCSMMGPSSLINTTDNTVCSGPKGYMPTLSVTNTSTLEAFQLLYCQSNSSSCWEDEEHIWYFPKGLVSSFSTINMFLLQKGDDKMGFFLALPFSWPGYLGHCILGLGCTPLIVIIIAPFCILYEHDLRLVPTMNWGWPGVQSLTSKSVRLSALTDAV